MPDVVVPVGEAAKQLDVDLLRAMFDAGARADGARGEAALAGVFDLLKEQESEVSIDDVNAVLELLLAHGANPNRRVGELPLAIAKARGDAKTVELLVKAGAREPPSATSQSVSPARAPAGQTRTNEFRDPWLPRSDTGARM